MVPVRFRPATPCPDKGNPDDHDLTGEPTDRLNHLEHAHAACPSPPCLDSPPSTHTAASPPRGAEPPSTQSAGESEEELSVRRWAFPRCNANTRRPTAPTLKASRSAPLRSPPGRRSDLRSSTGRVPDPGTPAASEHHDLVVSKLAPRSPAVAPPLPEEMSAGQDSSLGCRGEGQRPKPN